MMPMGAHSPWLLKSFWGPNAEGRGWAAARRNEVASSLEATGGPCPEETSAQGERRAGSVVRGTFMHYKPPGVSCHEQGRRGWEGRAAGDA